MSNFLLLAVCVADVGRCCCYSLPDAANNYMAEIETQQRISLTAVNTCCSSLGLDAFIIKNYLNDIHIDFVGF